MNGQDSERLIHLMGWATTGDRSRQVAQQCRGTETDGDAGAVP